MELRTPLRARSRRAALAVFAVIGAASLAGCTAAGLSPSPEASPAGPTPPVATAGSSAAQVTPSASAAPSATAAAQPARAPVDTRRVDVGERQSYGVVTLPLDQWDVRVDWPQDPDGTDLGEYIDAHPTASLVTNAGIFAEDLSPGGLLVSGGEELSGLNLADGWGNFHLKPNAVFEVRDDGTAAVVESSTYTGEGVVSATQSGPALLLDGQVHPAFTEGSANTAIRTGVGVSPDGRTVYVAITRVPVNLWDFALLFRDELGCEDALYLDGQISQLWVAGQAPPTPFLGPYSGVVAAFPR